MYYNGKELPNAYFASGSKNFDKQISSTNRRFGLAVTFVWQQKRSTRHALILLVTI